MTFYISWSGLGRELDRATDLVKFAPHGAPVTHGRPAGSEPDGESIVHGARVVGLLRAWGSLHPDEHVQITASGHAQQTGTGVHCTLSLNLTTTPAQEERIVDSSISGDPLAPEPESVPEAETKQSAPEPETGGEPAVDPTGEPSPGSESPGESAGPTESEPEPQPVDETGEPIPAPDADPASEAPDPADTPSPESEVQ